MPDHELPEQLLMDVATPPRPARGRDAFHVSGSNAMALALVDGWRDWPNGQFALHGPAGAGKTHLAHVWMDMSDAEKIHAENLTADDAPALAAIGAVVIEGGDQVAGRAKAETALFHMLNLARAEGCAVLLTGRTPPARWPVELPDLASRLSAVPAAELEEPDEALMTALLTKQFADRQLKVGQDVIGFLALRLPRVATEIAAVVETLDKSALAENRRITVPFVKAITGL
ncbi:MAG: HdaA/DnaA family protein [Pikeienuella sp.]